MSVADQDVPAVPASGVAGEAAMQDWAGLLVERARSDGVELAGDGGLLAGLVRQVLQTGLEVEMAEHLGCERCDPEGRGSGSSRNGSSPKRVATEIGENRLGGAPRPGGDVRARRRRLSTGAASTGCRAT